MASFLGVLVDLCISIIIHQYSDVNRGVVFLIFLKKSDVPLLAVRR